MKLLASRGRVVPEPERTGLANCLSGHGGLPCVRSLGLLAVELIPKVLVTGLFAAVSPGSTGQVTPEKLNRIWSELAPQLKYRQFQLAPDGSAAQFTGAAAEDGASIQLPLIQIRSTIELDAARTAEQAEEAIKIIARHLGIGQFFNLGIKHVYWATLESNDARAFVLHQLLSKTEDDLAELQQGGTLWGGVKYVALGGEGEGLASQYTVVIEPLQADNRYLFVDVDATFPGPADLDRITARAKDAERYLTQDVKAYLEKSEGTGEKPLERGEGPHAMTTKTQTVERDYNAADVVPTAAPATLLEYYYAVTRKSVTEPLDETRSIEIDTELYERVLNRLDTVGNWLPAEDVLGKLPENT
jgi:hypothetical protein